MIHPYSKLSRSLHLLLICLLVSSCDKSGSATPTATSGAPEPRVKSTRPESDGTRQPREGLRERMRQTLDTPVSPEQNQELAKTVWELLDQDPETAYEGFERLLPGSEERNRLIQHYALRKAEVDPEEASRWASSFVTEADRSLACGSIATVLAEDHPEQAARLISDIGVPGRETEVAVVKVVQKWSATSPSSAAEWVTSFDDGEVRQAGLKAVIASWITREPAATIAWLSSIQDETLRNEAMDSCSEAILEQPEDTQEQLLQQATPAMRGNFEQLKARQEQELNQSQE